jgi:hypothetical protein
VDHAADPARRDILAMVPAKDVAGSHVATVHATLVHRVRLQHEDIAVGLVHLVWQGTGPVWDVDL